MKRDFERDFRKLDPWNYADSPYENKKYRETIEMLRGRHFRKILEIGCAEGVFTEMLLPYGDKVVGLDISPKAVKRARERLKGRSGVQIKAGSITGFSILPSEYDLIVASEVLYYLSRNHGFEHIRSVCRKLANCLPPGGNLLVCHWFRPEEPHTVRVERGIRSMLVEAGLTVVHEEFREGDKDRRTHHYCLLLLEKPRTE